MLGTAAFARMWRHLMLAPGAAALRDSVSSASRVVGVTIAASIGIGLTLAAAILVSRWEARIGWQDFTAASETRLLVLQNGWNEYLNKLMALRAFFEASDSITRAEFETFTAGLLRGQSAVQNLAWVPRVRGPERAIYE